MVHVRVRKFIPHLQTGDEIFSLGQKKKKKKKKKYIYIYIQ